MIASILPTDVAAAHCYGDLLHGRVFPAEQERVAGAVEVRRREFTTTRECARQALGVLGVAPVAIIAGRRGEPRWPDGVVGSMTHCVGYRAAAVARSSVVASLGIDAEPHGPLPDGVLDVVSGAGEREHLAELSLLPGPVRHWDRLLFSAKESVFKAWYPVMRTELTFRDAAVRFDPAGGFRAEFGRHVPVAGFGQVVTGRWSVHAGILHTAVIRRIGHAEP
ncbi:4'-phosphopantetheinyl transferase superfamily protein [Nakamurella sp. YIM 132087]|uniref:4'-phosphopantetheinyl transferase superfamily protein n=1 Tax=Nakamurella alba TaxID=2665158 RepID=A0A7K1FPS4_9ACTN|nr:4'-phosphopantetheinyl transferase superfamily protein [Nakamurella alba]MTD15359.1 4'-phosphopantetheinyl transferase superfamily protein [Nakamurella alba]